MLIINLGFCQTIVTSNKLWGNLIHFYTNTFGTEHIKFTTDTVINSITYKQVERALDENQLTWSFYGYIREDSDKKIYYKINAAGTERLLYDLNVQLHSTIFVYDLSTFYNTKTLDSMTYYVKDIDSTIIGSTYHKRINLSLRWFDTTYIVEQWIDSVGSMAGMLHNHNLLLGNDYYSLLCFTENGILEYQDLTYSSCYVTTGLNEKTEMDPTVTIFPNPMNGFSFLDITGINDYNLISIHLYNLSGKEVLCKNGEKRIQIYKNDFSSGIYFYSVTFNNKVIKNGKIIIN